VEDHPKHEGKWWMDDVINECLGNSLMLSIYSSYELSSFLLQIPKDFQWRTRNVLAHVSCLWFYNNHFCCKAENMWQS